MDRLRRKWDNTIFIAPFTLLNVRLVNHIDFPFKISDAKKSATSLNGHACNTLSRLPVTGPSIEGDHQAREIARG